MQDICYRAVSCYNTTVRAVVPGLVEIFPRSFLCSRFRVVASSMISWFSWQIGCHVRTCFVIFYSASPASARCCAVLLFSQIVDVDVLSALEQRTRTLFSHITNELRSHKVFTTEPVKWTIFHFLPLSSFLFTTFAHAAP